MDPENETHDLLELINYYNIRCYRDDSPDIPGAGCDLLMRLKQSKDNHSEPVAVESFCWSHGINPVCQFNKCGHNLLNSSHVDIISDDAPNSL